MTAHVTYRQFTRDADRAMLGGVCAGVADYLGFNLCITRFLFVIFFCVAMPFALIAYIAIVLLVPAESTRDEYIVERIVRRRKRRRMSRRQRRHAQRQAEEDAIQQAAEEVNRRAESLEERLRRIEKHVTSGRYQLDEEFRNL